MVENAINDRIVEAGVAAFAEQLTEISQRHYRRQGHELLEGLSSDELARLQYARLLGVVVKQPYTIEVPRKASERTKSVIALRWKDETPEGPRQSITSLPPDSSGLWQSHFLVALAKEERPELSNDQALRYLLTDARYESRLGEHIFKAFRRYVCQDPVKSKAVKESIAKARAASGPEHVSTSINTLKVQAATLVAVSVAHALPFAIATAAAPVIGGIAFMLLQVGIDGFCSWSSELERTSQLGAVEQEDRDAPTGFPA